MSDDLHTPVVLAALSDPLKTINDLLHTRKVLGFKMINFMHFMFNFKQRICSLTISKAWPQTQNHKLLSTT